MTASPLVELRGLTKRFVKSLDLAAKIAVRLGASLREEVVQAVDDVAMTIEEGEVVSLVGEYDCQLGGAPPAARGARPHARRGQREPRARRRQGVHDLCGK